MRATRSRRRRRSLRRASLLLVLLMGSFMLGATHASRSVDILLSLQRAFPMDPARHEAASELSGVLTLLEHRAEELASKGEALDEFHAELVAPLIDALDTRMAVDRTRLTDIAIALIREGQRTGIDPRLLVAVVLVENPWLDLDVMSPVGAVGLMQVMPFHAGRWGCDGDDLTDPDLNICHGTRILADALQRSGGDLDRALLRYNGCVHGTNTPDCHSYPQLVYRRAGAQWAAEILERRGRLATTEVMAASPEAPM